MTPTLAQIQTWFNEFNQQVFDNKLPKLPIKITNNRRQLGQFYWGNGRGIGIKISTYYDMPVDMFRNTILHEMCHLYCYTKGYIREHHGNNWKAIAAYATRKTGLDITRCADISGIKPAKKNVEKQKAVEAKKVAPYYHHRLGVQRPPFHRQDHEESADVQRFNGYELQPPHQRKELERLHLRRKCFQGIPVQPFHPQGI